MSNVSSTERRYGWPGSAYPWYDGSGRPSWRGERADGGARHHAIRPMSRLLQGVVAALLALALFGCTGSGASDAASPGASVVGHLELAYAKQFQVDFLQDGTSLLTIGDDHYRLVNKDAPTDGTSGPSDATTIQIPVTDAYVAASSCMDFFRELDALDRVRMTSTKAQDWSLPEVVGALDAGDLLYVGKYSAPDYELVLSEGTDLVVESTMIYHAPEVAERLGSLGMPVLVERSSYETSPLGRLEWIKLYGLLTGRLEEAEKFFDEQISTVEGVAADVRARMAQEAGDEAGPGDRPSVAFFSLAASGHATVRKPGDYVSQMISLAGGTYFLDGEEPPDDTALSTMNMEMESFYEAARDADVIIYNSAIDAELGSIDDLVAKAERLADFKAVREDNVWCTGKDLFQQPTCLAQMVTEMSEVFAGEADEGADLGHLYRVGWDE